MNTKRAIPFVALKKGENISQRSWEKSFRDQLSLWDQYHFREDEGLKAKFKNCFEHYAFSHEVVYEEHLKSFQEEILKLSKNHLDEGNVEADFFYAIAPLTIYLRNQIDKLFGERYFENLRLENQKNLFSSIVDQCNYYVKENILAKMLVTELKHAKDSGILEGSNAEERFEYFIYCISNHPEWLEYLFDKYPVMVYKLHTQLSFLLKGIIGVFNDLDKDWELVSQSFFNDETLELKSIELFCGDLHQCGKGVCILHFNVGKLVYKPRSMNIDLAFHSFLQSLNTLGAGVNFYDPKILSYDDHSWMEFVDHQSVKDQNEVNTYYFAQGKALCVFFILHASDIIADNIIAVKNKPCFIDLESAINRKYNEDISFHSSSNFYQAFLNSVIDTGILPTWSFGEGTQQDIMQGALVSMKAQKIKRKIWENYHTDHMTQAEADIAITQKDDVHLPQLKGKYEPIDRYVELLISGFEEMYHFFEKKKKAIISLLETKHLFKNAKIRVIYRPTSVYSILQKELIHPDRFHNVVQTDQALNHLWAASSNYFTEKVIRSEMHQLAIGDIPYFYTYNNSNEIFDGFGEQVGTYVLGNSSSITQEIIARLKSLNKEDLKFQKNIIRGSVSIYLENFNPPIFDKTSYPSKKAEISKVIIRENSFIALSKSIGENLINRLNIVDNEIGWLGKYRSGFENRYSYMPLDGEFYDGETGIAFYFAYLYQFTHNQSYKDVSMQILLNQKKCFTRRCEDQFFTQFNRRFRYGTAVSPFSFPASTIYLMEHLSRVFQDAEIWDENYLDNFYEWLEGELKHDTPSDIMVGTAGAIQLLLNVYDFKKDDKALSLAKKCWDKLIEQGVVEKDTLAWFYIDSNDTNDQKKYLGGFAHGTAGIAFVLFRLSNYINDPKIKEAAIMALNYDRSLYSEEINGWIDGRSDKVYDAAVWCHGSAGIALSRVLISRYYKDETLNWEIEQAKKNIIKNGLGSNQCICHGDLGNLEVLAHIAEYQKDKDLKLFVMNYAQHLIKEINEDGKTFRCGTEGNIEVLGLFMGLSGMGYQLLRLFAWNDVPSVLFLEGSKSN